jgi:hypothetical protein
MHKLSFSQSWEFSKVFTSAVIYFTNVNAIPAGFLGKDDGEGRKVSGESKKESKPLI